MSIRHAANRFRTTPVDGWTGTAWKKAVARGSFFSSDRRISDRESDTTIRQMLFDPSEPLPSEYSVIRVADQVFLVGLRSEDIAVTKYSTVTHLRLAKYFGQIFNTSHQTAASGIRTNPTKTLVGTYYCDRENVTLLTSNEVQAVKYRDEIVRLPFDTQITTDSEIRISGESYEVKEVYLSNGLKCCRCTVRKTDA